jgi:hypothetical protein
MHESTGSDESIHPEGEVKRKDSKNIRNAMKNAINLFKKPVKRRKKRKILAYLQHLYTVLTILKCVYTF